MRGPQTKKDALSVIRLRLLSDLGALDYWTGSFDLGDEAIGRLLDARIALQVAIQRMFEAEGMMTGKE